MPLANITWNELNQLLEKGDFSQLFVGKLGWDYPESVQPFGINITASAKNAEPTTIHLNLAPVVEKKSVSFLTADVGDTMITKDQRRRAERELTRHVHEHIVIYHTSDFSHQVWQVPRREPGKPIRLREFEYQKGAAANELHGFVRKLHFSLRDEANLTLVDVIDRIDTGVQAEKVTKKFYDEFSKQRKDFIKAITGIADENDRAWYAAIMLNRLMFSWFLQSKGLLDNDHKYLRTKLDAARNGKLPVPNFQSFYDTFLKALFHDALNQPTDQRDPALKQMLGNIPYINGGIFDRHRLETENTSIQIPDSAFEGIFALFGQYDWHLDDRPIAKPNEINPDVLGHIFEKFVNQKEKGAYYTKEDVTGYMSQNTIIPWLLDHAKKKVNIAFDHTHPGSVWRSLENAPEKYIYGSMKHGVIDTTGDVLPMPEVLRAGEHDYSQRGNWNQRAEAPYALPTETWREYFHRRRRTLDLIDKLRAGEVHEIDDLITLNLDIRQFMQDIVATEADVSLVKALWHGVHSITILDPTVGSGAFLFAAVRVLEPIADELLHRMDALVEAEPNTHPNSSIAEFKRILDERNAHPNQRYFIMRQIILHNLYGVDIEEEAVEICKLRLFLLLVAYLDDPKNIEPLPDLDFNIRAGNTLVGYATRAEVDLAVKGGNASQMRLDLSNNAQAIDERAGDAARLFEKFKDIQTVAHADVDDLRVAKQQYEDKISELRDELDGYLYQQQSPGVSIKTWREKTHPFHWFAEFHRVVIGNGGFDVVIGNPPYVRSADIRKQYVLEGMVTSSTPNIYAMVFERSFLLTRPKGRTTMIVPVSITFSDDFRPLRDILRPNGRVWISSFDILPASLFTGVAVRCAITMIGKTSTPAVVTTRLNRWRTVNRGVLMEGLEYHTHAQLNNWQTDIPRTGDAAVEEFLCLTSCFNSIVGEHQLSDLKRKRTSQIRWAKASLNFLSVYPTDPPSLDTVTLEDQPSNSGSHIVSDEMEALAILAGESFMIHWWSRGDGLNVPAWTIGSYLNALDRLSPEHRELLTTLGHVIWERRNEGLVFKHHAGRYIGNYNYRGFNRLTRRADLVVMNGLGISKQHAIQVLDLAQRVLLVNENAGEKGIPARVKSLFPVSRSQQTYEEHQHRLATIDEFLCHAFSIRQDELDVVLATGYPQWPSIPD